MRSRQLLTPLAAAALAAAAGLLLPAAPATAATCSGDTGVSVVVDGSGEQGGVRTSCVSDGGGDNAADLFAVSHTLTRVQNFPGAVCKVDGLPADANCTRMPPADAYWGLFWSDGSGSWSYSSEGVDSLDVPDGGGVAFVWQDGGDQDYPAVDAPGSEPAPTTSTTGSGGSGSGGAGSGGSGSGGSGGSGTTGGSSSDTGGTAGGAATGGRDRQGAGSDADGARDDRGRQRDERRADRDRAGRDDSASDPTSGPTDAVTEGATADATTADPPATASDQGMPVWLPPSLAGGLFVAAGAVALARRRHTG